MKKLGLDWRPWALLWYGCLVLMGVLSLKFGHLKLSSVAIFLLSIYGLVLFSDKTLAGRSHQFHRFPPWAILCVGLLLAYTGDKWFLPTPVFDSVSALQNPDDKPMEIEGIHLGMASGEILAALGEPTYRQRHHLGTFTPLDSNAAMILASAMESQREGNSGIVWSSDSRVIDVLHRTKPDHPERDVFHSGQNLAIGLLQRAKRGEKLKAVTVSSPLELEIAQRAMRELELEELADNLLIVSEAEKSPQRALLVEGLLIGEHWRYDDQGLDILFAGTAEQRPMMLGGQRVFLGDFEWSHAGRALRSLHTPGKPLEQRYVRLFRDDLYETYTKMWGEAELRVGGEFGKVERLEIWRKPKSSEQNEGAHGETLYES